MDLVRPTDKPKGGDNGNGDDGDGSNVRPGCLDEPRERTRLRHGGQLVLTGLEQPVPLWPAAQPAHAVEAIGEHARGREVTLAIEPGDRVPVILSAEFGRDPGEVHTVDMTQTTSEGHVIGGMRLIVVNVPAWLRADYGSSVTLDGGLNAQGCPGPTTLSMPASALAGW